MSKKTLLSITLTIVAIAGRVFAQEEVEWASKVLESSAAYRTEQNKPELALGPPAVYPGEDIHHQDHDPYVEGYLLYPSSNRTKQEIKLAFPKPDDARQIVIGGIFNYGTIYAIYVLNKDGSERQIYKSENKHSEQKFATFHAYFGYSTVYGVKLVLDHSKISDWNVIKGIGITKSEKPLEIKPYQLADTSFKSPKKAIGESINSKDCYEFSPKVSPDGKTLFFVKECAGQPDQDIYYSVKKNDTSWSEAKNIGAPLNNKDHNFVASVSLDGRSLVIGNRYKEDGSPAGEGVSISYKNKNGTWSIPKSLEIPNYENKNDHANFYLSPDGTALLMAIQDKNSLGDLDIYVSLLNKFNKTWSEPINLGNKINTPFAEDYPFLAADGVTLYFSSKGYLGYGGHDIMMSKRLDDSWKNWSKPVNLGKAVNTKSDDKGFVIANEGNHAYFNSPSFNNDLHHMDIYKINLPKFLHQTKIILVEGKVEDEQTKKPLRARISIREAGSHEELISTFSDGDSGHYLLPIPIGKKYIVSADLINYFKFSNELSLTDLNTQVSFTHNILLSHYLDSGQTIAIKNILFDKGKSIIKPESFGELDKLSDKLIQQSKAYVMIGGHTDNESTPDKNLILSQKRAKAVVDYLVSKGVSVIRLRYEGFGDTKPLASNNTPEGREQNRRVELTVLDEDSSEMPVVVPVKPALTAKVTSKPKKPLKKK